MKFAGWVASLLLIVSSSAMACGHCIEDKIAAVYDYSVVSKAVSEKHTVLFFGVDGPIVVNAANKQALLAAMSNVKGVDANSARLSLETGSMSFAYDPKVASYASLLDGLEKKFRAKNLTLFPLDSVTQMPKTKVASR
jgi:hypothetical protein